MSQNIRTTFPVFGRHGKTERVEASGCKKRSDFSGVSKSFTEEASKFMPSLKALGNWSAIIEIFFC